MQATDTPPVGVTLWTSTGAANDVTDLIEQARTLQPLGVNSVWFKQLFDLDALSLAALVGAVVPGIKVGTSVVSINPRHRTWQLLSSLRP